MMKICKSCLMVFFCFAVAVVLLAKVEIVSGRSMMIKVVLWIVCAPPREISWVIPKLLVSCVFHLHSRTQYNKSYNPCFFSSILARYRVPLQYMLLCCCDRNRKCGRLKLHINHSAGASSKRIRSSNWTTRRCRKGRRCRAGDEGFPLFSTVPWTSVAISSLVHLISTTGKQQRPRQQHPGHDLYLFIG